MGKKTLKIVCASLIMCSMFALLSFGAISRSNYIHVPPMDTILLPRSQTYSKDTTLVLQRGSFLSSGTIIISNEGGGEIGIFATTRMSVDVDQGSMTIYLDRWIEDETRWENQKYYEYEFLPEEGILHTMTVGFNETDQPSGYYYRIWAYHEAQKDGKWEVLRSQTDGIMITSKP